MAAHDGIEVVPDSSPQHVASPDFNGEKVYVPPQVDRDSYPQTAFNTDPSSLPQVVGLEAHYAAHDPKTHPKALGVGPNGDGKPPGAAPLAAAAIGTRGGGINDEASESTASHNPWWKRKRLLVLLAAAILVLVALAVGLGVGLTTGRGDDDDDDNGNGSGGDNDDDGDEEGRRQGSPNTLSNGNVRCDGGLCPFVLSTAVQDETFHVFARNSNGTISMRSHNGGSWNSDWEDLGQGPNGLVSQPTTVSWDIDGDNTRRIDIVAVSDDADGSIVAKHLAGSSESWSEWERLGGSAGSSVQTCRVSDSRIDLWVTDTESFNITHNWWVAESTNNTSNNGDGGDEDEEDEDEDEADEDEADEDEVDEVTKRNEIPAGAWKVSGSNSWDQTNPAMGPAASAPGIVCRGETAVQDLVWYERNGNEILHSQLNRDDSGTWSNLGTVAEGDFVGDPLLFSPESDPETFHFFGGQSDGHLYTFSWRSSGGSSGQGSYSPLVSLGDTTIVSSPAVLETDDDVIDVVALGEDGQLKHQHFGGSSWEDDWEDLGVSALSAPTAVEMDERVWVMSLTPDGEMQASTLDAGDAPRHWASLLRTENLGGDLDLRYMMYG